MQSSAPAIRRVNGNNSTNSPPTKKHSDSNQRHHYHYRSQKNNLGGISDHDSIGNLSFNSNLVEQYGSTSENLERNHNENRFRKLLSNRQALPLTNEHRQFFEHPILLDITPNGKNDDSIQCLSSVDNEPRELNNNNYSQKVNI